MRARISSGLGRSASLMRQFYAADAIDSKVEDHVRREGELIMSGAVVVGPHVIGMVVAQFGTNGDESVRPPGDADGMFRILCGKAGAAADFVIEIFVSNAE